MSIETMKQWLEALEYPLNQTHENFNVDMAELLSHRAIESLRQAIEQAQVATNDTSQERVDETAKQRHWVGLTEAQCGFLWKTNMTPFEYYKAIEAKLKEKNT